MFQRLKKYKQGFNCKTNRCLNSAIKMMLCIIFVIVVQNGRADEAGSSAVPSPFTLAVRAAGELDKGHFHNSLGHIKLALQSSPDSATLHILAGSLLLNTGDAKSAKRAFENALLCDYSDALAHYGLGLAQLAAGHRIPALVSLTNSEKNGGDAAYILIARRYTQWLDGAQISIGGAGLPVSFACAQNALNAMSAFRLNKLKETSVLLKRVDEDLPGESLGQTSGLLITFDQSRSIISAAAPMLQSSVLSEKIVSRSGLNGDIVFSPDNVVKGTSYATYEMEGQTLSLTNSPPFQVVWDSRQMSNGLHNLTVVLYSQSGVELSRASRRIRIFNPGGRSLNCTQEELEQLRSNIWETLSLKPDRGAIAYIRGLVCRSLGDKPEAATCFAEACALHPDFVDSRSKLASAGGLNSGEEALWGGLNTENVVALTFDDGPKPGLTEPLLQILTDQKIPATFFVIGRHVTEYPELTKKISDAGIEIANHSYTHPNLTKLSLSEAAAELMRTQTAIARVTGKFPRYMRPPGGNWNKSLASLVKYWGLTACMWSVDAYGAEVVSAQQVADTVLSQVHPGSIILMHNGKMSTIQALPTVISELKRRGYKFATVSELERRVKANQNLLRQVSIPILGRSE